MCALAPDAIFFSAGQALCGHAVERVFTHAFGQMRLDNTTSIDCGTFAQIRTQIHRPTAHPYRRLSGIIIIINKHMRYAERQNVKAACGAIGIYNYPKKLLSTKMDKAKKQTILLLTF